MTNSHRDYLCEVRLQKGYRYTEKEPHPPNQMDGIRSKEWAQIVERIGLGGMAILDCGLDLKGLPITETGNIRLTRERRL